MQWVFLYGSMQLLLSASQTQLHDSPATMGKCYYSYSHSSPCMASLVIITDYCVNMFWYTVQQHITVYKSYVKCGFNINCQRKFCNKFPKNTVPSIRCICIPVNKVRCTGSLLDKKPTKKCRMLTEQKLDEIGTLLEHTSQKSMRHLARGTGISKSLVHKVNFNLFKQ
jgi:hypothetical protein